MRDSARVVIIGGGVGGTSIAYHLAQLGWTEVVLLDRSELTSGSTFHSAGLVGQLRSSVTLTKMMMYGTELYRRLHGETGYDPGWREVGSLRLASSPARMEELDRQAGWARTFGLPLDLISTEEAHRLFHGLFDPTGVLGAVFLPTDGHLNPSGLALALADGARKNEVEFHTNTRVTGIGVSDGRVTHVDTDQGRVNCEIVVNAGGIFAYEIGRLAGVNVPVMPMAHQYAHTRPSEEIPRDLPTMRDPDRLVYFREEVGGLLMGGYERNPMPWHEAGFIPADFNNRLLPADLERFLPLSEYAQGLVPVLAEAQVTEVINGPEAFTPDGEFILGESEIGGLFVAAGFCAHGIAGAGGIGKVMAEWIVGREPPMDLWKMDIRRFGPQYQSRGYCLALTDEIYSTYYDIVYPNHERQAGRPLRTSPVYPRHQALGAMFGEKSGWERVNWYQSNDNPEHERMRPRGWAGQNWSTAIVTEHLATRDAAALFDESSFAKIEVSGPGACDFLQRMCANDVGKPPGRITYTALLNSRGGVECDLTVTRLEEDRFLLVTGSAFGRHDLSWLKQHSPPGEGVEIRDVTTSLACLGLWGPRAGEILSELTSDDLSFPFMSARHLTVGDVPCWALRVTYVGEAGWELYPPTEYGLRLWDTILEAGRPYGLLPAGYRAIDSLRMEKGYRVWGADITSETDPYSAGLGFAVRPEKGEFLGKEAISRLAPDGGEQRLVCLVLADPRSVALSNEPVKENNTVVGRVSSGGLGYHLEASIAYAWVPAELSAAGTGLAVEVFGVDVPAEVRVEPLYDPKGERIRSL
ncbi:MAG TPA: FAD-dependent oxidoreductase [Acidimicrobiia bacterium]|nr:FAD-dependent oxidoreductase [Acidimicrobiia bacterium]